MPVIDLSQLPAPQIMDVPNFETLLAEHKASFIAFYAAVWRTLRLESESVTKLLQAMWIMPKNASETSAVRGGAIFRAARIRTGRYLRSNAGASEYF